MICGYGPGNEMIAPWSVARLDVIDGVHGVFETWNHRMVEWWNDGVGCVVESSSGEVVGWWSWWSCRIIESSNIGMVE